MEIIVITKETNITKEMWYNVFEKNNVSTRAINSLLRGFFRKKISEWHTDNTVTFNDIITAGKDEIRNFYGIGNNGIELVEKFINVFGFEF